MGKMGRIALIAALVLWYGLLAVTRLIDGDEGYLLYAAKMVSHGYASLRDFFNSRLNGWGWGAEFSGDGRGQEIANAAEYERGD